jgi:MFS family permease
MFSGAVAMLVLSQARSLPAIDALAALTGLTNEMYRPACSALLADLVPAGQRVTAFSALRASFNAGFAFGPAVAGFLAGRGYFWLFIGDAATSALFGLVALAALPATTGKRARTVGWTELGQAISRDRALRWIFAAVFAAAIVYFQQGATLGLHVARLGFPTTTYGAILSLNGALVVLVELPLTTITRRFPARGVIALGFLLSGVGFALNGLAHTVPELLVCMAIFTLGEMLAMPMTSAYVADLAPESMRGRYMGVYGLAWPLALMVGPELGLAAFAFGGPALWLMCAGLGLLAALLVLGPTLASLAGFGSRLGPAPRPESG